jgi:hypothetical protein
MNSGFSCPIFWGSATEIDVHCGCGCPFLSTLQSFCFQMVLIPLAPLILWEFFTLVFPRYMRRLCEQNLIDICVCIMYYYATLLVVIDSVGRCSRNAQQP